MRNTYTSKPTGKRSTHTIFRNFGIFSTSIKKILFIKMRKPKNTIQSYQQNRTHTTNHTLIQVYYIQHHIYQTHIITIHYH